MTAAIPFPTAWGYDQIVGGNTTNIVNASVTVWTSAGDGHIIGALAFGFIPILLMVMVYIKYQSLVPAMFALSFSALGMYVLDLLPVTGQSIYIILIGGLTFFIWAVFWKKG